MGYMRHHTIVVQGDSEAVAEARSRVIGIMEKGKHLVSPQVESLVNMEAGFFIAPDGSKEGWDISDAIAAERDAVCAYLRETDLDWFRAAFGGDDPHLAALVSHNNDEGRL